MPRIARLFTFAGLAGGSAWLIDARRRATELDQPMSEVMGRDFRGFVTHRFNPAVMALGLVGGRRSAWGLLEHVGRASGSTHHTPVLPIEHDDHVYVRLTYGEDVHWVRNVRATGHCRLQHHEAIYDLDEPMVVRGNGAAFLPRWASPMLAKQQYLRLHVLDMAPGTFAHPRATVEWTARVGEPLALVHPATPTPEDSITPS